ncbi:MAG: hypothetical protein ACREX3_00340 [Gammaproteobacteria bacterium]
MATDSERPRYLSLLPPENDRAEPSDDALIEPPGFGTFCPGPPYDPGPRRRLPRWARGLVDDLCPLKLVE